MALFDNNNLLSVLGGQNLTPDASQEQLQNLRNFGTQSMNAQLPSTIYSPWQGVAYLLDKFQGRNALDSAAAIQKQAIINKFQEQQMPGYEGTPFTPTNGSVETQPQSPQQAILQQPHNPGSVAPKVEPVSLKGTLTDNQSNIDKYILRDNKSGQESVLTKEQMGGDTPPDGMSIVGTMDSEGNVSPIGTRPTVPTQSAENQPQQSPQETGSNPAQTQPVNNEQHPQAQPGMPIHTNFGTLPPIVPTMSPTEAYHFSQLPPDQQKAFMEYRKEAWTPVTQDFGYGTAWRLPPNAQHPNGLTGFYVTPKVGTTEISPGSIKLPSVSGVNPETGKLETNIGTPSGGLGSVFDLQRAAGNVAGDINASNAAKSTTATGIVKANQDALSSLAGNLPNYNSQKQQISELKRLEALPDTANVTTGHFAEFAKDFKSTVNNFLPGTFDPKALSAQDTYEKLTTQFASGLAKDLTSRPTQFDFATKLNKEVPNFKTTPEGRKAVLSMYELRNEEDIAKATIANEVLQSGGSISDFNNRMNQWYDNHQPVITVNGKQIKMVGRHVGADSNELLPNNATGGALKANKRYNKSTGKLEDIEQ